jgi:hypothetical protein
MPARRALPGATDRRRAKKRRRQADPHQPPVEAGRDFPYAHHRESLNQRPGTRSGSKTTKTINFNYLN